MTTIQYSALGIVVLLAGVGGTFIVVKFAQFLTKIESEAHKNNKSIELGMFWITTLAVIISIASMVFNIYQNDRLSNVENRLNQIETRIIEVTI